MLLKQKQQFYHLSLGEPLTACDLQNIDDSLVVLTFRGKAETVLCRWGLKRKSGEHASYQGFWTLDNSPLVQFPWNTYGTDWQAYRVNLPRDIRDIAVCIGWR